MYAIRSYYEQIIAFCLIYRTLAREIEKKHQWNQMDRSEDEFIDILPVTELEEFFSPQVIAFYNDNYEIV